jgi:hypothetical protein
MSGGDNKVAPRTDESLKIERDTILEDVTFEGVSKLIISNIADRLNTLLGDSKHFILTNDLELYDM